MSGLIKQPRTSLAAILAVGALGGLAAVAVPAQADVKDTDRPRLTAKHHDFGKHWLGNGPRDGGYLKWDYEDGSVNPQLSGYHYLSHEECGRVRMDYYDDDHNLLGHTNGPVHCAPGDGKTQWWTVIDSYSSPDVDHVHVLVQREESDGSFTIVESTVEDFD